MKSILAVLLLALSACSLFAKPGNITGPEARQLVASGALLIDVRSPGEFADGHIDGAMNIPVDDLAARLAEIPRGRPIVLYCRSGRRSSRAAETLRSAGYEDVKNLGPMDAW